MDAVRAAQSALGQVEALLDAVDSAASDIRHAVDALPSVVADTQTGIQNANQQLQTSKSAQRSALVAVRDAAAAAVDCCRGTGSVDPLGAFARLTKADADLNRQLAALAKEQADADRLRRSLEQALFTAQARVRGVSEYVDTRRGSVGPEARTRLAAARRHLQAADDKKPTNPTEAIAHANAASTLAAQAQSLANADVQSAQRAYGRRGGNDSGAVLGGIVIGDILNKGMRGGFGGWSPGVVRRQVELVRKRIRRWLYGWRRPILITAPTRRHGRRPRNSPTANGNTRRFLVNRPPASAVLRHSPEPP